MISDTYLETMVTDSDFGIKIHIFDKGGAQYRHLGSRQSSDI